MVGGVLAAESPASPAAPADESRVEAEAKQAALKVRGHGLWGNLRLRAQLRLLLPEAEADQRLDSFTLEDAAMLLLSTVQQEGYLRPTMEVDVLGEDGTIETFPCRHDQPLEIPRALRPRAVTFRLQRGTFYHYAHLTFTGLTAIPERRALSFFLVPDLLLPQRKTKVYTPARLNRGLANLREELRRQGWRDAVVAMETLEVNHEAGKVTASIRVVENRRYWVTEVATHRQPTEPGPPAPAATNLVREAFSEPWQQNLIRSLRNREYVQGFAEAEIKLLPETIRETATDVELRVNARVTPGPPIRVGGVHFEGLSRTRESVVRRRARFEEGDPLNRLAIEDARVHMLRLGVFDQADVEIVPAEPQGVRDVRYQLRESKSIEFSVMAGYGSYELLRGGIELEQINLFGLAHRHRLLAVQSFKSTKLEYAYTIPQVLSPLGELTALGFFRQREETTFTRRDDGGSLGYLRLLPGIQSEVGLRLAYEELQTRDDRFNPDYGLQEATATSVGLTFSRNRTDNPLDPQAGHRFNVAMEFAQPALGARANFSRFEVGASWHRALTRTLLVHAGASHALVATPGEVRDELPFNKRYFLGGANSVRGYVQGEAASFDATGKLVGDESYLLGQLELEQRLTARWSLLGFLDVAGLARDLADYPAQEVLSSVGAGLRWRTPIGPVRLEYGHNLNRRPGDPSGTVHVSVGYPF